jgi:phosphate transport system permease protein
MTALTPSVSSLTARHGGAARRADRWLAAVAISAGLAIIGLVIGIAVMLYIDARPSIAKTGWSFLTSDDWNPVSDQYGALSCVYGTVVSAGLAMLIAVPLSIATAVFLSEIAGRRTAIIIGGAVELLAAVPSIILGMWGMFVLSPLMANHLQPALQAITGEDFALFSGPPMGIGMLTAAVVLALMVLPLMCSVCREIFGMTPRFLRESGYGMGATRFEVIRRVILPHGRRGMVGAGLLGLSRALGETMAVTFVIGNNHQIHASLFAPANTISSTLANEFTEASEPLYLSALIELGLVLMGITLVIQIIARWWLGRVSAQVGHH